MGRGVWPAAVAALVLGALLPVSVAMRCVAWRAVRGCDSLGPRDSLRDRACGYRVPSTEAGFCECDGGAIMSRVDCGHANFTCREQCALASQPGCVFDATLQHVSCGGTDPVKASPTFVAISDAMDSLRGRLAELEADLERVRAELVLESTRRQITALSGAALGIQTSQHLLGLLAAEGPESRAAAANALAQWQHSMQQQAGAIQTTIAGNTRAIRSALATLGASDPPLEGFVRQLEELSRASPPEPDEAPAPKRPAAPSSGSPETKEVKEGGEEDAKEKEEDAKEEEAKDAELKADGSVSRRDAAAPSTSSSPSAASPSTAPTPTSTPSLAPSRRLVTGLPMAHGSRANPRHPDFALLVNGLSLVMATAPLRRARADDVATLRRLGVWFASSRGLVAPPSSDPVFLRQEAVRRSFLHAWKGYESFAWGHDNLRPVSKRGDTGLCKMALTLVDSLDTMLIMGLGTEFQRAREFVANQLVFGLKEQEDINVFETTIRVLGGLLSAYALTHDVMFLDKAADLGNRLLPAFDTPTGLPLGTIGLHSQRAYNPSWTSGASSVSEVGTVQVEFTYLSRMTGRPEFEDAGLRVMRFLAGKNMTQGLYPIYVHPETGLFHDVAVSLGARGDSLYEYFLKQWLQFHATRGRGTREERAWILALYNDSVRGILDVLLQRSTPSHLAYFTELNHPLDITRARGQRPAHRPKMDHLVCFVPGMLALGVHFGAGFNESWVDRATGSVKEGFFAGVRSAPEGLARVFSIAEDLLTTCYQMYATTTTGLAPEIVTFLAGSDFTPNGDARHSLLRPETVESLFLLWRLTHNPKYRDWGWEIFTSLERFARVHAGGYSGLRDANILPVSPANRQAAMEEAAVLDRDPATEPAELGREYPVDTRNMDDSMESFFLAETLKYLYLLFSEDDLIPLDEFVFNTEAHPLPLLHDEEG